MECKGVGVCPHNRIQHICKQCKGSGICAHNKERRRCKLCKPYRRDQTLPGRPAGHMDERVCWWSLPKTPVPSYSLSLMQPQPQQRSEPSPQSKNPFHTHLPILRGEQEWESQIVPAGALSAHFKAQPLVVWPLSNTWPHPGQMPLRAPHQRAKRQYAAKGQGLSARERQAKSRQRRREATAAAAAAAAAAATATATAAAASATPAPAPAHAAPAPAAAGNMWPHTLPRSLLSALCDTERRKRERKKMNARERKRTERERKKEREREGKERE